MELVLPSKLILYSKKSIHLIVMEIWREIHHLKDTIKQQDVSMVFSKRRLDSLDVFRYSVEKLHNSCTTQLVSSIVFESSYFIRSSEQNSKKDIEWSTSLALHSVFDKGLICFFEELQHFFSQSLILPCVNLGKGKKKPWH